MNSIMFQPHTCRFFLYAPFSELIRDQLQILPFDPINGIQLYFQSVSHECHQSVTVEIDPQGNISEVTLIDPETGSTDLVFNFKNDFFTHHGDQLGLICGHPQFHRLQQTLPAHFTVGHYTVKAIAL